MIGRASLGARLVSVETGSIWWTGKHNESGPVRGRSGDSLVLADITKNIALAFPERIAGEGKHEASSSNPKEPRQARRGRRRKQSSAKSGAYESDQQRLVKDEFLQVLIEKGYSLVSRSDMASVMKEQTFQRSGVTEDNAAALGKLLNVPAVLVVRITQCTARHQRSIRSNGQVLVEGTASYAPGERGIWTDLVVEVADSFPHTG